MWEPAEWMGDGGFCPFRFFHLVPLSRLTPPAQSWRGKPKGFAVAPVGTNEPDQGLDGECLLAGAVGIYGGTTHRGDVQRQVEWAEVKARPGSARLARATGRRWRRATRVHEGSGRATGCSGHLRPQVSSSPPPSIFLVPIMKPWKPPKRRRPLRRRLWRRGEGDGRPLTLI